MNSDTSIPEPVLDELARILAVLVELLHLVLQLLHGDLELCVCVCVCR